MSGEAPLLILSITSAALLGSWHCAAMCGPIAASLATRGPIWPYHLGRALGYLAVGALAGAVGRNFLFSESLAARAGFAALMLAFYAVVFVRPANLRVSAASIRFYRRIFSPRNGAFALGFFSPLLPCGWLWTFIAAAAAAGSARAGALVTGILWLSSVPALSAFHFYFRRNLGGLTPARARVIKVLLACAGVYSILSHLC